MAIPHPLAEHVIVRLMTAGCVAAEDEAGELLAAAPDADTLESWLRRREQGEPLPWIIGRLQFCGARIHVAAGVYVPRIQTEGLARRAAGLLPHKGWAADLCTGAGAVAVHLMAQVPTAMVVGIDIDAVAAACARRNGVRAVVGDLDGPFGLGRRFDLITAVPPYVPTDDLALLPGDVQRYEPRIALHGGDDGLDVVKRVVTAAGRRLRPGGWLVIELGGSQDETVSPALAAAGFDDVVPWWDSDGDLRGLAARAGGQANWERRSLDPSR